jgi:hypothetical protein
MDNKTGAWPPSYRKAKIYVDVKWWAQCWDICSKYMYVVGKGFIEGTAFELKLEGWEFSGKWEEASRLIKPSVHWLFVVWAIEMNSPCNPELPLRKGGAAFSLLSSGPSSSFKRSTFSSFILKNCINLKELQSTLVFDASRSSLY